MKTRDILHKKAQMILGFLVLLVGPLSAQEAAIPDFSRGMPDVELEKKEQVEGKEIFHLKTGLDSKAFDATLKNFLGAGWGTRKLGQEEMRLAASKARFTSFTASLVVYQNPKVPGVAIRVIHLEPKEEGAASKVEIAVIGEDES